ncbi:hypothetical protein [Flavobacterium sp. GT3R68]|uniref:hypothetical protein n=1 Tax=Flavobacterium sp. GT3R68 TaxID=2594437 RepID=UPI000F8819AD|nr:hypothetical protein [Flavobacterium sp. GT3R68]RTY89357.1 hypothetical protein EKL32_23145 [Flavobacterium sp. GSN2]TRW93917.1 hypothetical protein FNW07_03120 [Flavobacterium sp. GT3R68]
MQNSFEIQELEGKYMLIINGIYYTINEITYFILNEIKSGLPFNQIAVDVEKKFGVSASENDIESILQNQINPLFEKQHKLQNSSTFWLKKELLSFGQYEKVINPFKAIFKPSIFWIPFFTFLILNLYWLFSLPLPTIAITGCEEMLLLNTCVYVSLFVIVMLHELSHASSALNFGVKAKSIGFGFYSVFPVFFADITGIWPLSKSKRMIVNLSGIYVQSILGILLYFTYQYFKDNSGDTFFINFLYYIFIANAITILVNLFPFFKFDGYWCYSDLFNAPNLGKRSKTLVSSLIKKIIPFPFLTDSNEQSSFSFKNLSLIIYTFFKGLTNIFLLFFIGKMVLNVLSNIMKIDFSSEESLSWCTIKNWLLYALFMWVIGRIVFKFTKKGYLTTIKFLK